jgi:hypothetical protein
MGHGSQIIASTFIERIPIIFKYLHDQTEDMQLEALYSLQSFDYRMKHLQSKLILLLNLIFIFKINIFFH